MSNKGSGFTRKTLPADEITLNAEQIFPGPGSLPINMLGMQSILSKVARKLQNSASLLALIWDNVSIRKKGIADLDWEILHFCSC